MLHYAHYMRREIVLKEKRPVDGHCDRDWFAEERFDGQGFECRPSVYGACVTDC